MSGHSHSHHDHAPHGHVHENGSHGHGAGGHCHTPKVNASNRWRVGLAALLTGAFMVAEVAGGLISGSLALLADAGHMLTDFAALAMAWGAFRLAARPANAKYNYGYDRVSILVAFVNALTLFVVAGWIVWEAFLRFSNPGEILAGTMLWVAIAGLIINLIVFWILLGADQNNLNIRGAVLHVLGDLLGSVAAIAAAVIILTTGWTLADPILSVLVAILILRAAWSLMKDSGHVLLQGAPMGLDGDKIGSEIVRQVDGVTHVDHVRIWSLTPERSVISLTIFIGDEGGSETISKAVRYHLNTRYHLEDVSIDIRHRA